MSEKLIPMHINSKYQATSIISGLQNGKVGDYHRLVQSQNISEYDKTDIYLELFDWSINQKNTIILGELLKKVKCRKDTIDEDNMPWFIDHLQSNIKSYKKIKEFPDFLSKLISYNHQYLNLLEHLKLFSSCNIDALLQELSSGFYGCSMKEKDRVNFISDLYEYHLVELSNKKENDLFFKALESQNLHILNFLLEKRPKELVEFLAQKYKSEEDVLKVLFDTGTVEILKLLDKAKVINWDYQDSNNRTALFFANTHNLKLILEKCSLFHKDKFGQTALNHIVNFPADSIQNVLDLITKNIFSHDLKLVKNIEPDIRKLMRKMNFTFANQTWIDKNYNQKNAKLAEQYNTIYERSVIVKNIQEEIKPSLRKVKVL